MNQVYSDSAEALFYIKIQEPFFKIDKNNTFQREEQSVLLHQQITCYSFGTDTEQSLCAKWEKLSYHHKEDQVLNNCVQLLQSI